MRPYRRIPLSPLAAGLFHRAVIESGPVIGIPMSTLADAEKAGVAAAGIEMAAVLPLIGRAKVLERLG